jgi:hypothetical protein
VRSYAIRAEGLVKRYGHMVALDGVDLEVPAGKVIGVLRPNGVGHSPGGPAPAPGRAIPYDFGTPLGWAGRRARFPRRPSTVAEGMISTRRVLAAVALAAGASALAMPAAEAAPVGPLGGMKPISLDDIATSAVPAEHKAEIPTVNEQLGGLNRLNELHQVTDLVAPVTGILPSVS